MNAFLSKERRCISTSGVEGDLSSSEVTELAVEGVRIPSPGVGARNGRGESWELELAGIASASASAFQNFGLHSCSVSTQHFRSPSHPCQNEHLSALDALLAVEVLVSQYLQSPLACCLPAESAPQLSISLTFAPFSFVRLLIGTGSSLIVCSSLRGDAYCVSVLGENMLNVRYDGRRRCSPGEDFGNGRSGRFSAVAVLIALGIRRSSGSTMRI